jgi:hypothetical protein
MALTIVSSGDAVDFASVWAGIESLVDTESRSVARVHGPFPPGYYEIKLELIWDIDDYAPPLQEGGVT